MVSKGDITWKDDLQDPSGRKELNLSTGQKSNSPNVVENASVGDSRLEKTLSEVTARILEASLRVSTRTKYKYAWNGFTKHCIESNVHYNNASIDFILDYFSKLYNEGKSFSVVNNAKLAISHYLRFPPYRYLSEHPKVNKYFIGLHNLRPPIPKMTFVWDVSIVFRYFLTLKDNKELSQKEISQKLCLLLLLIGAQRVNTIFNFKVTRLIISEHQATFTLDTVLKHSKIGRKLDTITYRAYPDNKRLCVIDCLNEYLKMRDKLVDKDVTKLLITYGKPYKH